VTNDKQAIDHATEKWVIAIGENACAREIMLVKCKRGTAYPSWLPTIDTYAVFDIFRIWSPVL